MYSKKPTLSLFLFGLILSILVFVSFCLDNDYQGFEMNTVVQQMQCLYDQIVGDKPVEHTFENIMSPGLLVSIVHIWKWSGWEDPERILVMIQGLGILIMVLLSPLSFYYFSRSRKKSIFYTIVLCIISETLLMIQKIPRFYWASAVVTIIFLLPTFKLLNEKEWMKVDKVVYIITSLVIVAFNWLRGTSTSFIIFVLLLVVTIKQLVISLRKRDIRLIAMLVVTTLFALLIEKKGDYFLYSTYKDAGGVLEVDAAPFVPWHSFYIGLGNYENPYGIYVSDSSAAEYVTSVDPSVRYCSEEYFEILKERYFEIVRENPLFVGSTLIKNFFYALAYQAYFYIKNSWMGALFMVCILPFVIWRIKNDSKVLGLYLLFFLSLILGMPQAVFCKPYDIGYQMGSVGVYVVFYAYVVVDIFCNLGCGDRETDIDRRFKRLA